jgi:molecular chaperone GrpE
MKPKNKENPKEEKKSESEKRELADFDDLLERLLPLGKETLSKLLEERRKYLSTLRDKQNDDLTYELEIEKAKNDCWKEYANILLAQYQRVSADFANFQKRIPKQISDTIAYEKERIIKSLLPALDNFEHTLQNAHSAENVDVFIKGIRIIYDQFLDILKSHNVEQIKALGEVFDPALHQAMRQNTDPDKQQDVVLEEFQKGYKLNDRVIRPSRVVVNKLPTEETNVQQENNEYESTDTE